ncbi:hypothetical protein AAFF27_05115 [Xylophilus sp. GW821-FHT01B05]
MSLQSAAGRWGGRVVPVLLLSGAALLSGCVVAPPARVVETGPVVYAPVEPPAPQVEVIGMAPSPLHVWIGGSWFWEGGRYAWRPGRWATPPRPGYAWVPHRWERGPGGWRFHEGHWGGPRY